MSTEVERLEELLARVRRNRRQPPADSAAAPPPAASPDAAPRPALEAEPQQPEPEPEVEISVAQPSEPAPAVEVKPERVPTSPMADAKQGVARVVARPPKIDELTFGELLRRSLLLRPR
jgi:hypothetical protein